MAKYDEEKIVSATNTPEDNNLDQNLRPQRLGEFVGQEKIKENLRIFIQAAKEREQALEHVLLNGGPGLGKTTMAYIIAKETNVNIRITSGPALERAGDLASILTNLNNGDILFIDEIHRLNRVIEEVLYPAMEDFGIDLVLGKGPAAKTLRLDLPRFTLIGATTRPSMLSSPLRDRFGAVYQLDFYQVEDIKKIIKRSAKILGIKLDDEAAQEIAKRARYTPRIANRLLKRVRDFAQVHQHQTIDQNVVDGALEMLEIDSAGLNPMDRKILTVMIEKFKGGPVGVKSLAIACGEELEAMEEIYEPYLIQSGFLHRTARGRVATDKAYQHLGFKKGFF
ncbi:MAG: Holliday junction branch migration DNA helicase RuvB [Patescibacteria group bacterium]|nr:Holliday junction branch migration DNA helicase RuvB [Patescibacteria group bacterium]MDD5121267.1 Holliday junction branch migration DNA helicase RuvB [Patescibacteria group bacterium]MDD5395814.1 Holliday junction branch migration DNA helicase RuvB [Patescibacteria group bacterium]